MAKNKNEQNDPKGCILKSHLPVMLPGVDYQISIYQPSVVMDSHMHVMSGGCSPLPFLWKQLADKTVCVIETAHLSRETIEGAGLMIGVTADMVTLQPLTGDQVDVPGSAGEETQYRRHSFRQSIPESRKSTKEIGDDFIKTRFKDACHYLRSEPFHQTLQADDETGRMPFLLCVIMPMDMEFAHLDGYYGLKIYNAVLKYDKVRQESRVAHYWMPLHGRFFKKKRDEKIYDQSHDPNPLQNVKIDAQLTDEFDKNLKNIKKYGLPGIYCEEKDEILNRVRINVKATPCILPDSETRRYESWEKQLQNTELAMLANPLKLFPLFHYDPRRWQVADTYNDNPFTQVSGSGLYLGFKLYTAQGYRPWDMRLPVLRDFYRRCRTGNIPILNHCTPGGAYSFDRELYYEFLHQNDADDSYANQEKADCGGDTLKYFNDNFVAPDAWRKVLDAKVGGTRLSGLRLCLAHFGGGTDDGLAWCKQIIQLMKDYDNVYADISSSMADESKHPKTKEKNRDRFKKHFRDVVFHDPEFKQTLRHRILFGSDWYMTLLDRVEYLEYFRETKKFLDDLDTSLWLRFTQANPYRFYRLDEANQIDRIKENIIDRRQNNEKVQQTLKRLDKEQISEIEREAAFIRIANKPYVKYEES